MHRTDILHSVGCIEKLNGLAKDAREKELSAAQIHEALAMKECSGYSMYNFIHLQVNSPAALGAE